MTQNSTKIVTKTISYHTSRLELFSCGDKFIKSTTNRCRQTMLIQVTNAWLLSTCLAIESWSDKLLPLKIPFARSSARSLNRTNYYTLKTIKESKSTSHEWKARVEAFFYKQQQSEWKTWKELFYTLNWSSNKPNDYCCYRSILNLFIAHYNPP